MKNYIANEDGHWDTSKGLIRRRLRECIELGRRYRANGNKKDQYEAFRLLGTGRSPLLGLILDYWMMSAQLCIRWKIFQPIQTFANSHS